MSPADLSTWPVIRIHGPREALAVFAAADQTGRPVVMVTAPAAGAHAGGAWFAAMIDHATAAFPNAAVHSILDCGGAMGVAIEALKAGLTSVAVDQEQPAAQRVQEMAEALGGRVHPSGPPALDLSLYNDEPAILREACISWINQTG